MRHVVVGAGGIGGLLAGVLAREREAVTLLVRPGTSASYPTRHRVESAVLGTFDVEVPVVEDVDFEPEVLWLTVKATQLEPVLLHPPAAGCVIPFLNGIDHIARLRGVYGDRVLPGAIRVESERRAPGHVVQPGPFLAMDLAPSPAQRPTAEAVRTVLERAGVACSVQDDEAEMLWRKLAMLAPSALATSSVRGPVGDVRRDPELERLMLDCAREVCAVAATQGVSLDADRAEQAMGALPDQFLTSMARDVIAGNEPELDAIGGPIVRLGREHGVPTPATAELMRRVAKASDPA